MDADLGHISLPTLILFGREHVQFPWPRAQAASRKIPAARFAVIDGAGHFPMVGKPKGTAELLLGFLDELESPAVPA